jgi:acetaldehyde dehydrogenase (acetylating)
MRDAILNELKRRKAYICTSDQTQALTRVLLVPPRWGVNPECVGQSPGKIAKMAGFDVPADTSVLVVEIQGVGREHPMSAEKLSPVLSVFFVKDWAAALCACEGILRFGGLGHTSVIHSRDDAHTREYARRMPAMRVLANTSSPQGSTGITTDLFPAMTLGCGAVAGNITGDNIGPLHLVNIKRLAYAVRKPEEAFEYAEGDTKNPVSAAVERWLTRRGLSDSETPKTVTSEIVDRFLETKRGRTAPAAACCAPSPPAPAEPAPPAPPVVISEFVCENDVRTAIARSEKIYIGPKTIVTPAARDLAGQYDVLVVAKR